MLLWKYHYFCKVKVNQKCCYFISLWSVMTPVALRSALATQVRRTKATTPSRSQTHHGYLHSDARSSKTKIKGAWGAPKGDPHIWIFMSKIDFQAIWNKKKTGKWKMTLADSPPLHPYYGILFSIIFLYIFLTLP